MNNEDIWPMIATERVRVADMFESLEEPQWSTLSLCGNWTVRDLAGHLISPFCLSLPRFAVGIVFSGGFAKFNSKAACDLAKKPTDEIVATLRANTNTRWTPPGHGPTAPLTDICVHGRDATRALGLAIETPLLTWSTVMEFLASNRAKRGFIPSGRLNGLTFRATDQEWSTGVGPEVAGPSESLALAMTGRAVGLDNLTGDGVGILRSRLV